MGWMTMSQVEAEEPDEIHFEEQTAAFPQKVSKTRTVSRIGLIGYHDTDSYPCVNLCALTNDRIHLHNG